MIYFCFKQTEMYVSGAIKKRLELMNVILNVSFIVAITLSVEMRL